MEHNAPIEGPVLLVVTAYYAVPKSWSKKKRMDALNGHIRPVVKPDLSNIVKAIEDGMNKIVYKDDSQIVSVTLAKYYDINPRVEVEVRGLV